MNTQESIFHKIETIILQAGVLPENFEAEEREYADNELRFAPGAMEGIFGHHVAGDGEKTAFVDDLKTYLQMPIESAMELFESEKAGKFSTASVRDGLMQEIIEHKENYDLNKVADLGYYFAQNGHKCETVKLGLTLLALFNFSQNETVCYLLKTLGYCEEFTDYVLMSTYDWAEKEKQDFYFELAKKLTGWGKIDVVEMMDADTEEKKEWILCHGCKNSILYSYLGLECARKCDLHARLEKGNFTEEELRGASDIMEGLIDEGPCGGMSVLKNPVELTLLYLTELEKHALDAEYLAQLSRIDSYFNDTEEIDNADLVCSKIRELVNSLDIERVITDSIAEQTHECVQIAKMFDIDLSEQIMELLRLDFNKYYTFSYYLLTRERYIDEFFELCDKMVDVKMYPKKMGDSLGLGKLTDGTIAVDMIVQYLDKYPLKGKKLIEISIHSPIIRWRNMAAKALNGWTEKLNRPLAEIDVDLYEMVKSLAEIECNDSTKEEWNKLIK